jgi:hypothetical protein
VTQADVLILVGVAVLAALMVVVVRRRARSHAAFTQGLAEERVCAHLRPAWELLRSRGHRAVRVGQKAPEFPLEIHLQPPFDPRAVYDEMKLGEPVFVSDRNVLYCKQDWCELHPTG